MPKNKTKNKTLHYLVNALTMFVEKDIVVHLYEWNCPIKALQVPSLILSCSTHSCSGFTFFECRWKLLAARRCGRIHLRISAMWMRGFTINWIMRSPYLILLLLFTSFLRKLFGFFTHVFRILIEILILVAEIMYLFSKHFSSSRMVNLYFKIIYVSLFSFLNKLSEADVGKAIISCLFASLYKV